MRRESEFIKFLITNKRPKKYANYCKDHIEKAFGGMDMDEIIVTHQNISNARKKLESVENEKSSIDQYMTALNWYLKFALSKNTSYTSFSKGHMIKSGLVVYENSVPTIDQDPALCEFLESEYVKIIEFAKDMLRNIPINFDAIPVYISEKQPTETYYKSPEFLLSEMKKHCSKCERECSTPPYCCIAEVLWKYKPITQNIDGEFYSAAEPHIVLYYKNFNNPSVNNKQFLANIAQTLAHEYMHYLHYSFAKEKFSDAKDELTEAIADFFGVLYSIKCAEICNLSVAKKRYELWQKHFDSDWPYAYALYFLKVHNKQMPYSDDYTEYERFGCIGKFLQIFGTTRYPKDAYKALLKG